jgi:hypothetical protein
MRSAILCDFNSNLQRPGRFECVCLLIYWFLHYGDSSVYSVNFFLLNF